MSLATLDAIISRYSNMLVKNLYIVASPFARVAASKAPHSFEIVVMHSLNILSHSLTSFSSFAASS